jgi:MFS-type transporter involved in bile tolerance (Atg22 family)
LIVFYYMWKFALKTGILIFLNLFAFLIIWNILDEIFESGNKIMVFSLILSIFPLLIILHLQISKARKQLEQITKVKPNGKHK